VFVAYGDQAREQVMLACKSLVETNSRLPFWVIADEAFGAARGFPQIRVIKHEDTDIGARGVKLQVDKLSPFDHTLYLDADVRVMGDITRPFGLLDAGWELVMAPTLHQGQESHLHINATERDITYAEVGVDAQALQGGVMYFRKTTALHKLFATWRAEWARWGTHDQAALVRALAKRPVKLRTLHRDWYNSPQGRLIRHYYGFARRKGLKGSLA